LHTAQKNYTTAKKFKLKEIQKYYLSFGPLIRFFINGIFLVALWFTFYSFLRYNELIHPLYEKASALLTQLILFFSEKILDTVGLEAHLSQTIIYIDGASQSVNLMRGCLGRNLMGIFAGFILAFPGNYKHKLWYIPTGIAFIVLINIFRVIGLAYNSYCCPENTQFNHDTFFNYSIYLLTFVMWTIWVQKFSPLKKKKQEIK